jgi:hypothetical protein
MPEPTDEQLVRKALREVLQAPGVGAKALAAKAQAARQLALLDGLHVDPAAADREAEDHPDPMADLDEMEAARQKRARRRAVS